MSLRLSLSWRLPLAVVLLVLATFPVLAQEADLRLSLSRDWGYGGPNGNIQGTFSFRVEGPDDLVSVQFFIDDQLLATDTQPPWRYQFSTDNFALGPHQLYAAGLTAGGEQLTSNVVQRTFVPEGEGWEAGLRIALPLIVLAVVVPSLIYLISWRRDKGRVKRYGMIGAAICPNCGHSFGMHWWAPNLLSAKYDRCPHCGKWGSVRRASRADLERAEAMWSSQTDESALTTGQTEADKLRKQLEDSRFDDI